MSSPIRRREALRGQEQLDGCSRHDQPEQRSTNWEQRRQQGFVGHRRPGVRHRAEQLVGHEHDLGWDATVKITSSVKTNITSLADSSAAGSGAGIAVAVVITDSEAFIDSTAVTPVTAESLTVSADTDNTAPTTGITSPRGAKGEMTSPRAAATGARHGKSKTSDGNQNLTAALGVTVLVATTQAYIAPNDTGSTHTISTSGGTQMIHAGAKNTTPRPLTPATSSSHPRPRR